jgi:hypothetical protein
MQTEFIKQLNVFGRRSVRISAGTPAILTEIFHGFCQCLHVNSTSIKPVWLISKLFPIHYSPILLFDAN